MNTLPSRPATGCQVLVVGAGPTGLVLAAELLARGIRTRIIDQGDGVARQARAIGIHARTLEVLTMMGLTERFLADGQVVRHMRFYSEGRCLASVGFARCGSRFGFMLNLPQDQTERLLRARVAELGGLVENRTELLGLTAGGDAVTAAVRGPGGRAETITAGYVVGCDGAHSRVRRELGLTFHGHPYPQDWLLADVLLDWDLPEDATHAFFRHDGLPVILFPMRGHRWRLTLPFAGTRDAQAPTLEEIQRLTDQRAPRPVTVSDPSWLACFRSHRRSASAYRRDRVMLAGDAVHIHSPAGGQGLNTGMIDAHNLGWKLALVAAGRAPDALLDTYGAERRPVAESVLRLTHALVRYGSLSHPVKRRVRDVVVPALGRSPVIQRRAARRMSQVYVSYPPGPLVRQNRYRGALRAGQRMPDIGLRAGGQATTLHTVLRAGRHVPVVPAAHAASMLSDPALRRYRSDLELVTPTPGDQGKGPLMLIRPDGHIAALGRPGNMDAMVGYLRDLFTEPAGPRDQRPEGSARHAEASSQGLLRAAPIPGGALDEQPPSTRPLNRHDHRQVPPLAPTEGNPAGQGRAGRGRQLPEGTWRRSGSCGKPLPGSSWRLPGQTVAVLLVAEARMPHDLLAAPFLGRYLLLRPGSIAGVQLPRGHFGKLAQAAAAGGSYPPWLAALARQTWQLQLPDSAPMAGRVLVRQESRYGYGRASWEINLGCNYACSHCYLGLKEFSGLPWPGKARLLGMMRDAGVVWLQITGGEPTIDKDFADAYRLAFELGMMLTVSTNGSRLWRRDLLELFTGLPPYRLVISLYGATEAAYDGLTQRRGSYKAFRRGIAAAIEAGLPVRLNIVVTDISAAETAAMAGLAEQWGVPHNIYTNMTPTIYGGGESLLAQSAEHLRTRKAFTGCNAGHTFFHADPHGKVSICKVGRDDQIDLIREGLDGLRRLGGIADQLMLRTGGCSGCQLTGTCRVCRPLAKQFQEAKAPLSYYCQHGDTTRRSA